MTTVTLTESKCALQLLLRAVVREGVQHLVGHLCSSSNVRCRSAVNVSTGERTARSGLVQRDEVVADTRPRPRLAEVGGDHAAASALDESPAGAVAAREQGDVAAATGDAEAVRFLQRLARLQRRRAKLGGAATRTLHGQLDLEATRCRWVRRESSPCHARDVAPCGSSHRARLPNIAIDRSAPLTSEGASFRACSAP
jgi:hypothetical protein